MEKYKQTTLTPEMKRKAEEYFGCSFDSLTNEQMYRAYKKIEGIQKPETFGLLKRAIIYGLAGVLIGTFSMMAVEVCYYLLFQALS